jgi:hypothetical protein
MGSGNNTVGGVGGALAASATTTAVATKLPEAGADALVTITVAAVVFLATWAGIYMLARRVAR